MKIQIETLSPTFFNLGEGDLLTIGDELYLKLINPNVKIGPFDCNCYNISKKQWERFQSEEKVISVNEIIVR